MSNEAIATLRGLCDVLAGPDASVERVAASLGEIIEDQGGKLGVAVRPNAPQFTEAMIVRTHDDGSPAHVRLSLAQPATLSAATLMAAFGSYRTPPKMRPGPTQSMVFSVDSPEQPYTCTLIGEVLPGPDGVESGTVQTLTVRRDKRLPDAT
jgi:hypothetical protein